MLPRLVSRLVRSEVAGIRRGLTGLALVLFALVLVLLAIVFMFLALYAWLSTQMAPWQAALVVTLALLVAGLVFWLVGRLRMRRRIRRDPLDAEIRALANSLSQNSPSDKQKLTLVAAAAVIGLIIGRRLTG